MHILHKALVLENHPGGGGQTEVLKNKGALGVRGMGGTRRSKEEHYLVSAIVQPWVSSVCNVYTFQR